MPENKIDEIDILNFALNLEYLEAEFYTYATTGKSISSFGIGAKGRANGDNPPRREAPRSAFPKRSQSFTILRPKSVLMNAPMRCCFAAHSARRRLQCPTST